jgi:hypothetical protein
MKRNYNKGSDMEVAERERGPYSEDVGILCKIPMHHHRSI